MTETEKIEVTRLTDDEACERVRGFLESADCDDLANMVSRYCENGPITVSTHKGESDIFEDGERIQVGEPVILARTYDDGHVVDVFFDAELWFKQATDEAIRELAVCGWGGDYPADVIADYMSDYNNEVLSMHKYRDLQNPVCGYECHVDVEDAMKWLNANRPHLSDEFLHDEDITTDGTLKEVKNEKD
jgi:hypothetical protein